MRPSVSFLKISGEALQPVDLLFRRLALKKCVLRLFLGPGLVYFACARQIPPSGGPPDTTPPFVLRTAPEQGATRVPRTLEIEFEFSEKIDRDTFAGAVFVSPMPPGELAFKHKGRKVRIVFPDSLLPDRTYVITIGTDVRDNHNVAMAEAFTLAFTTGDSIDTGEISGHVYAKHPQGVQLWAYILPDSGLRITAPIDPRQRRGDYITQAGENGAYRIPFISHGRYRVFAVNDQARDGVYNPGEDQIGIADRDVQVTAGRLRIENLDFRLMLEDTLGPVLSSASLSNRQVVEVRFDEPVVAARDSLARHFVLETLPQKRRLPVVQAAAFPLDPSERLATGGKVIFLRTALPDSMAQYLLRVVDVTDTSGNQIDTAYATYEFDGIAPRDTVQPRIVRLQPADGSSGVWLDQRVEIVFNEWMQTPDSAVGLMLLDSARTPVPGRLRWSNPFALVFTPDTLLESRARYSLVLDRTQIRDLAGNALFDTLETRTFTTINIDTLSSIAGKLETNLALPDSVPIYMQALQVEGGTLRREIRLPADSAVTYRFPDLLPGVYRIEGYFDLNRNARYDYGRPAPFVPAEPFFVYPDSAKIRARWPNEGNDIRVMR